MYSSLSWDLHNTLYVDPILHVDMNFVLTTMLWTKQ